MTDTERFFYKAIRERERYWRAKERRFGTLMGYLWVFVLGMLADACIRGLASYFNGGSP